MLRRSFQLAMLLLLAAAALSAGEVIERIVATVNNRPILQSDWDEEVRYEAFVSQRPLAAVNAAARKAALEHLIDQELLRQQIREQEQEDVVQASPPQVQKRVREIRKQHGAQNDAVWRAGLRQYGLTERDLVRHLVLQKSLERLIDVRLRPTIHISHSSIEAYYREQLLPELHKAGAKDVPLVEVSPKIEELLTQQRMNELLSAWLHDLRSQSSIRMDTGGAGVSQR